MLAKEIRNQARLTSSTLRLVVQFDKKSPKYWVEKASGLELRDTDKKETSEDDEDGPKSSFQIFKTLTKKEKELPKGFYFNSLEVTNQSAVSEGYGFIYFSPEGFVDASALQISNEKNTWTFIFNPLTGQADFLPGAKSLKEVSR